MPRRDRQIFANLPPRCRKGGRIFFIPLQHLFDEAAEGRDCAYWIWDGIHPTESGHALIAREWIKAFKAMFE